MGPAGSTRAWRTAFPVVPVGSFRFGNSGRSILDGPGTASINAGLCRRFRFSDTKALQVPAENFNLPNTRVDVLNGATVRAAKTRG